VRLLLDTHAFVWLLGRPEHLSPAALSAINDSANEWLVSVVSLWEIAIKVSIGKMVMPMDFDAAIELAAAEPVPLTLAHIKQSQHLPVHHRDPFDRMLIAQAIEEGLTIVTRDRIFQAYGVPVLAA
jgi:PIN domain nuclease of toxin-antitoxin system